MSKISIEEKLYNCELHFKAMTELAQQFTEKIVLLERKLELCKKQRNLLYRQSLKRKDFAERMSERDDRELEELK